MNALRAANENVLCEMLWVIKPHLRALGAGQIHVPAELEGLVSYQKAAGLLSVRSPHTAETLQQAPAVTLAKAAGVKVAQIAAAQMAVRKAEDNAAPHVAKAMR